MRQSRLHSSTWTNYLEGQYSGAVFWCCTLFLDEKFLDRGLALDFFYSSSFQTRHSQSGQFFQQHIIKFFLNLLLVLGFLIFPLAMLLFSTIYFCSYYFSL
ncbi:hypothetical protein PIB30_001687 [Stylosanthes scabra]|uniref:Uncharacterized protein n=1 Tax=Stylosanthes scabra TaxID=79078 RepID=A0ABU6U2Y0_9FABA|nr:hypothetical protein [Stylosanthes scabra]